MRRILLAVVLTALSTFTYASAFKLSSPEIKANHMIPQRFEFNGFGCSGENKSPALKWSGAPKGTKSFAVTLYDPDAPTGSGWWHWVVFDIPADVHELAANAGALNSTTLPKGAIQGRTDYGVADLPAERRQAASLYLHRICAQDRQTGCSGWRDCRTDWLYDPWEYAGKSQLYRKIRARQITGENEAG